MAYSSGEKKYIAKSNEKAADSWDVKQAVEQIEKGTAYKTWAANLEKSAPSATEFKAAFRDPAFEAILTEHPIRESLKANTVEKLQHQLITKDVPWADLGALLAASKNGKDTVLTPLDTPQAKDLRAKWTSEPLAWKSRLMFELGAGMNLNFPVKQPNGQYAIESLPHTDALVASALSEPAIGQQGGRQLLLRDAKGEVHGLSVITGDKSEKQAMSVLRAFFKDQSPSDTFSLAASRNDDRPAAHFFGWDPGSKSYRAQSNESEVNAYDAAKIAHALEPLLNHETLSQYIEWQNASNAPGQENILRRQEIRSALEDTEIVPPHLLPSVEQHLARMLSTKWASLGDHRNPRNVAIKPVRSPNGTDVFEGKEPGVPRIALIYQRKNFSGQPDAWSAGHVTAVQTYGAKPIIVSGTADAEREILKAYKENQNRKIDVLFASHGNASLLENLLISSYGSEDPATQSLLKNTKGMLNRVYMVGCDVGSQTDSRPDHLLKLFVGAGAKFAAGANRTMQSNNKKYYLSEQDNQGQMIFAVPSFANHPWRKPVPGLTSLKQTLRPSL